MKLFRSAVAILFVLASAFVCDSGSAVTDAPSSSSPAVLAAASASPVASSTASPVASSTASPVASSTALPVPAASLPNHALTPGESFTGVTAQQVCVSGYAGRVRDVLREQYVQVYASYGIAYPEPSGTYELDHLVPLELGGDNTNRNLWPEAASPVPGFHQKDQLENYLHDAVCGGRMALADAQVGIASDWIALYRQDLQP